MQIMQMLRSCRKAMGAARKMLSIVALVSCSLAAASSQSYAKDRLLNFINGRSPGIEIPQGQFYNARTAVDISKVVVGDDEVATAVVTSNRALYILGNKVGTTTLSVFDDTDRVIGQVKIEVGADSSDLLDSIREAVPNAKIRVDLINGRTRLSGTVPDSIALRRVLEIAQQYGEENVINSLRVTGGQQVMLEVRFIEANRNAGRELGISWFGRRRNDSSGRGIATGAFHAPDSSPTVEFNANLPSGNTPFVTLLAQALGVGVNADILVQALEQKGLARRLAEPNLVALSGEKASFLAGGEIPIPVSQENNTITVSYKEYGVRLNFIPTVLDGGLINLKLQPEVSDVDRSTTVSTGTVQVPGLITRRAETTIELRDGQSFAMAGLLQSVNTKTQEQLPWIGQLPILGALFRSSSFQQQETDLVIIVTPRLVRPSKPGQPLKTPLEASTPSNDLEFFLLGQLELDKKAVQGVAEGKGVIGPYGHIVDVPASKPRPRKKVVKD